MTSSRPAPKGPIRNVPAPQGKPSVYSRFIPREELNDFAAWTPGAFDGGTARAGRRAQRVAPPASPGIEPGARRPPRPPTSMQALLHATRQQAYQDGYRDGLVALEAFKQSHARQVAGQIGALLQSTAEQLDELQQQMAQALASAGHQPGAPDRAQRAARPSPELVGRVAIEALDTLLLSARHITLRVHPEDQPIVAEGAADVLTARGGRIVADARGGARRLPGRIGHRQRRRIDADCAGSARWPSSTVPPAGTTRKQSPTTKPTRTTTHDQLAVREPGHRAVAHGRSVGRAT